MLKLIRTLLPSNRRLGLILAAGLALSTSGERNAHAQTLTVLHTFPPAVGLSGVGATGPLVLGTDGNYYGTTSGADTGDSGEIFAFSPGSNAYTVVYSFPSTSGNGLFPSGMILANDGKFYGTTWGGGVEGVGQVDYGGGTLYQFDPSTKQVTYLHMFHDGSLPLDGIHPTGELLQASNGKLYGVTTSGTSVNGQGTIFSYDIAQHQLSIIHKFMDGTVLHDGYSPSGALIQANDGNLYGVTSGGGAQSQAGVIYQLNPTTNVLTILHQFDSTYTSNDGDHPVGPLLQASDGALYGTAGEGGAHDEGTFYKYDLKSNQFTLLHTFYDYTLDVHDDGTEPDGQIVQTRNGIIYGTCLYGGTGTSPGNGTIYKYDPVLGVYSQYYVLGLNATGEGTEPAYLTELTDGSLLGTTANTLFRLQTIPSPPTGLMAAAANRTVILNWTANSQATSYNVYRSTTPGGEGATAIGTGVTDTSFKDTGLTNGVAYYYKITALNGLGESKPSAETSATPTAPAVTFSGIDATTQGNWRDKYGVSGFNVIGDSSKGNPHYATGIALTPGTHSSGLWAATSLAPACLQPAASGNPNRLAGIWYQTSWTMNVNVTGTRALELYLLDLNNAGYAETITIKDAVTGTVLNTQNASSFTGGKYYIWNVSGNVNVTFTSTAGHWAVLSGIFFGGATGSKSPTQPTNLVATQSTSGIGLTWTASTGATSYNVYRGTTSTAELTTPIATGIKTTSYTNTGLTPSTTYYYKVVAVNSYAGSFASTESSAIAPSPTSTATFVTADTTTHGNWKGVYGIDGYNVIGDTSGPNPSYPAYATVTATTHTSGIWASTSTDPKALQKIASGSTTRIAGLWYNTTWSMNVNVTGTHKLALYLLDYPNAGYAETVTIKDAATGVVLDTRSAASFQNGLYEVWNISGNVTVTLTSTAGHWAPISGIFFG